MENDPVVNDESGVISMDSVDGGERLAHARALGLRTAWINRSALRAVSRRRR